MKFKNFELNLSTVAYIEQDGHKIYSKQDFVDYLDKFKNVFGIHRIEKARQYLFMDISPVASEETLEKSLFAVEYFTEQEKQAQQAATEAHLERERKILEAHGKFFIVREDNESFLVPFNISRFNPEIIAEMNKGRMSSTVFLSVLDDIKKTGLPFTSDYMPSFDDLTYALQCVRKKEYEAAKKEFRNINDEFEIRVLPVTISSLDSCKVTKHAINSIVH